jgi:hypothetical protein
MVVGLPSQGQAPIHVRCEEDEAAAGPPRWHQGLAQNHHGGEGDVLSTCTTLECRAGAFEVKRQTFFFTFQSFTPHCCRSALTKLPQLGGGALMLMLECTTGQTQLGRLGRTKTKSGVFFCPKTATVKFTGALVLSG